MGLSAWAYGMTAAALALFGLGLSVWGLVGDRSRGRRRCPRCWYDMSGTLLGMPSATVLRCPECGTDSPLQDLTVRTRRRWRWVRVGILLMVMAGVLSRAGDVQQYGPAALAPNLAVIGALPFMSRADNAVFRELDARVEQGRMWHWQRRLLAGRLRWMLLHSPDSWSRREAAKSIWRLGDDGEPAAMTLWQAVTTDGNLGVVGMTLVSLESVRKPAGLRAQLARCIRTDGRPGMRRAAIEVLTMCRAGAAQEAPAILAALHDPFADVRRSAILACEAIPCPPELVVPSLLELLSHDDDPTVRTQCMATLAILAAGQPGVAKALKAALKDPDPQIRSSAARSLSAIGDSVPDLEAILRALLTDNDITVRATAQEGLKRIGADAHP